MNVKILLEYEGTAYSGWQRQKNALSIQEVLETAIGSITGEKIHVAGSGRTDAGVHALGQVANFKTETRIPLEKLPYAINSKLPKDIVVKHAEVVPEDFHARFAAKAKIYIYTIYNAKFPSPLLRKYSYFFPKPLDVKAMEKAADILIGTHDFASFMASGSPVKSAVRRIDRLEVLKSGDVIKLEMQANGFLYNMARIIAGTLLDVGINKKKADEMVSILKLKDRSLAGRTLPPQGLCLVKVIYH
jgi:tRNA pseudouridine38-40 synthase